MFARIRRPRNNMAINVSDLPPKYQEQAMKKYMEQQKQRRGPAPPAAPPQDPAKGTKYHNTPTERVTASGAVLHFDSQKRPAGSTFWLPARQGGRSAICASRWISPCRKRLPTRRESGCGRSATRRILHTTSRQTGSYTEVMRHTTQNKAGCPGSSSWRT